MISFKEFLILEAKRVHMSFIINGKEFDYIPSDKEQRQITADAISKAKANNKNYRKDLRTVGIDAESDIDPTARFVYKKSKDKNAETHMSANRFVNKLLHPIAMSIVKNRIKKIFGK